MNIEKVFRVILFGIVLSVLVAEGVAQTSHQLEVNVPFNFTVCSEQLPAGKYKLRPISSADPRLVIMSSDNYRAAVISCAHDVQAPKRTTTGKLVFNRYGNEYFLSELWLRDEMTGRELLKSEREEAAEKEAGKIDKRVTIPF